MTPSRSIWRQLAFAQALIALTGSFYFSYGLGLAACILCLIQRSICGLLVLIIGLGVVRPRRRLDASAWFVALAGAALAIYQHLLQTGRLAEPNALCSITQTSCATRVMIGPVDIPTLAGAAFLIIALLLAAGRSSAAK